MTPDDALGHAAEPRRVAVLGLGAMGSRVADRVEQAGHEVRRWSRRDGVDPARSVDDVDVVLVCVRDDDASREVWDVVGPAAPSDAALVDLSTVTPDHAAATAARLGPRFVEAPMVGSRPQVEGGQLVLLLAGQEAVLDAVDPVLATFSAARHRLPRPGDPAALKLVVNGLLAAQLAAAGELLAAATAHGLDPRRVAEVLGALPVASPALARSLPRALDGDLAPLFPLDLVVKDLGYLGALLDGPDRGILDAVAARASSLAGGGADRDVVTLLLPDADRPGVTR
ncbi:MAG: NAD(P)-binding domain-containing protein [Dermatophilaceae bacterium]